MSYVPPPHRTIFDLILRTILGEQYRSRSSIIIIIMYLSCSWATCWPVPVSRIKKSFQRSTKIPSASWGVVWIINKGRLILFWFSFLVPSTYWSFHVTRLLLYSLHGRSHLWEPYLFRYISGSLLKEIAATKNLVFQRQSNSHRTQVSPYESSFSLGVLYFDDKTKRCGGQTSISVQ